MQISNMGEEGGEKKWNNSPPKFQVLKSFFSPVNLSEKNISLREKESRPSLETKFHLLIGPNTQSPIGPPRNSLGLGGIVQESPSLPWQ